MPTSQKPSLALGIWLSFGLCLSDFIGFHFIHNLLGSPFSIITLMYGAIAFALISIKNRNTSKTYFASILFVLAWTIVALPIDPALPRVERHLYFLTSTSLIIFFTISIAEIQNLKSIRASLRFLALSSIIVTSTLSFIIFFRLAQGLEIKLPESIHRNYLLFGLILASYPPIFMTCSSPFFRKSSTLCLFFLTILSAILGSVTASLLSIAVLFFIFYKYTKTLNIKTKIIAGITTPSAIAFIFLTAIENYEVHAAERFIKHSEDIESVLTSPNIPESTSSAVERARMLSVGLDLTSSHFIFGVGLGNTRLHWIRPQGNPNESPGTHLHNQYLEISSSLGLVSGLLYFLIITASLLQSWKIRKCEMGYLPFSWLSSLAFIGLTNTTYSSAPLTALMAISIFWAFQFNQSKRPHTNQI